MFTPNHLPAMRSVTLPLQRRHIPQEALQPPAAPSPFHSEISNVKFEIVEPLRFANLDLP
jgi:hypothetical protein